MESSKNQVSWPGVATGFVVGVVLFWLTIKIVQLYSQM